MRWKGRTRPALDVLSVYPRTESGSIPTWIGVGGNPESVVRAARYEFSLMLAIIGGSTQRFAPFASLFREALAQFGFAEQPVGVHCLLAKPGIGPFGPVERPISGYVAVPADWPAAKAERWIQSAHTAAAALPAKPIKPSTSKKRRS